MKNGLHRICQLSLVITLLLLSAVYSSDGKWDIEIALSKQDYMLHEPIALDVILTNATTDTLRTHGLIEPNQFHFHIVVTDSDGKEMKYTGPQSLIVWGPGELLLDAGEQDYNCFNLLELFKTVTSSSDYGVSRRRFPFIPKGSYTVTVVYEGDFSNERTFNIIEPYGQEAEVLKKIEQASHLWSQTDAGPSARAFGAIVHDHPNSVYAEQCYYLSTFYSLEFPRTGLSKRRILKREMLSEYPNSGRVRAWLELVTFGKNEDEQVAIYDEFIGKYPNTRCSKVASLLKKRLLAKRERGE